MLVVEIASDDIAGVLPIQVPVFAKNADFYNRIAEHVQIVNNLLCIVSVFNFLMFVHGVSFL